MVDKPDWVISAINSERIRFVATPARSPYSDYWVIETLEGTTVAYDGDYVMMGAVGEFYPCREDVFEKTYDILEEEDK